MKQKKVILYGNEDCPGCIHVKGLLESKGIKFGYVDVLGGLAHLKKFLTIRDSHPDLYAEVVSSGKVGIPTLVVDDTEIYLSPDDAIIESLMT